MLPSATTVAKMTKNKNEKDNENENKREEIHESIEMNESRRYDDFLHTQLKLNSNSFDSPSDMRKMNKITSVSSIISNKNMNDVRVYGQNDDVLQGKGVKTRTNDKIKKETDNRAVRRTKTITRAGVMSECTCHPIAWSLITSSCLSRGKK